MSEKLSKEELLEDLRNGFNGNRISYRGYEQIKSLIENQPEVDEKFIEKWVKHQNETYQDEGPDLQDEGDK